MFLLSYKTCFSPLFSIRQGERYEMNGELGMENWEWRMENGKKLTTFAAQGFMSSWVHGFPDDHFPTNRDRCAPACLLI
jgi:hypothetical protein